MNPNNPTRPEQPKIANAEASQRLYQTAESAKAAAADHITDTWGKYPINGGELSVHRLCDLETSHLENIIITQRHIPYETSAAILLLLKQRYQENK